MSRLIAVSTAFTTLTPAVVAGSDATISPPLAATPEDAGAAASETAEEAKRTQARGHAMTAFAALDAAAYSDAIAHFSRALDLLDVPTLRLGRAEAFFRVGKWQQAKADYEAALTYTLQPTDSAAFAQSQVTAKSRLQDLERRLPRLRVQTPADYADVTVDRPPAVRLLSGERLALDPGAHRVIISVSGVSVVHDLTANEGQVMVLSGPDLPGHAKAANVPSASRPTPAATPRTTVEDDTGLIVSASVTGALAVATVITGFAFRDAKADFDRANPDLTISDAEVSDLHERAKAARLVLVGLAATTLISAGLTTYFWLGPQFSNDSLPQASAQQSSAQGPSAGSNSPPSRASFAPTGFWLGATGRF